MGALRKHRGNWRSDEGRLKLAKAKIGLAARCAYEAIKGEELAMQYYVWLPDGGVLLVAF